jgi:hypothetical protein
MKNKKRISILLMGGLGNQVFQLVKAQQLKDLGYKVSIDTSNFKEFEKNKNQLFIHRKQVFPISYFDFNETSFLEKSLYNLFTTLRKYHLVPKPLNIVNEINDYSQLESSFSTINKAIGYWQDLENLRKYKNFAIHSLTKNEELLRGFNSEIVSGSTLLHVRRGDYVNLNENLNDIFYEKSLDYCKNNIESFHYEVFTDDYEWVKSNKVFKDANYIHSDNISVKNTIKSFGKMINNENFIIGNSTFSLIAAVLSEKENSKVIVADPWFKNKKRDLNLPDNWIKIKR